MTKIKFSVTCMALFALLAGVASPSQVYGSAANLAVAQQQKRVSGSVRDAQGEPIIGADIAVQGGSARAITDANGNFSIQADASDVIVISYIGFKSQQVKVGNRSSINITLQEESRNLNEVVVVGYGTQKKVNLTGAVEQVTSEVFDNRALANTTQMLQGAIPNLQLNLTDGKPSRTATYQVRGISSIGQQGSALVLIDGVEGDPAMLNPNDIESVSVLKDAASAAIYGARGTFGVVLITTKAPKQGRMSVTYNGSVSFEHPTTVPDFVTDGYTYASHFYEAYNAWNNYSVDPKNINKTQEFNLQWLDEFKKRAESGQTSSIDKDQNGKYIYYASEDYYDALYKDLTMAQNHNVTLQGDNGKLSYYLSGRFYDYNGLFRYNTDKFKSYNLRAKGSMQVFKWLRVSNNFEYGKTQYHNPENVGEGGAIWRNIQDEGHPCAPIFNPDGSLTFSAAYTVGDFIYGKNGRDTDNQVIRNTVSAVASFLNNELHVTADFTFRNSTMNRTRRRVPVPYEKVEGVTLWLGSQYNDLQLYESRTNYLATNIYADYEHTFGGLHYMKAMAGFNYEQQSFKSHTLQRNGLLSPDTKNINLAIGEAITTSGGYNRWRIAGGFFRLNYAFANRYLLEVDGRYDGSSKFPNDQQWAFFPSVSAGWRVTEEPFWKVDNDLISNLKVRASYGSLGNGNVSPYSYLEIFSIQSMSRVINGALNKKTSVPAARPKGLTWETATTADAGVDLAMFRDRLTFSFDYYVRKTKDMYTVGPTLPEVYGASAPKGNYADMTTRGWELSLAWHDKFMMNEKPFHYNVRFTLADCYSVIDKYNNPEKYLSDYYEGMRLGEIWGYVTEGLFKDQEDIDNSPSQKQLQSSSQNIWYPGDIKFRDLNHDNKITYGTNRVGDSGDRKIIGNSLPRYTYSINLGADWNGIFFSTFFQGVGKQDWYPSNESMFWGQYNRPYNNLPKWQLGNYWTKDNPDAYLPRYAGYTVLGSQRELGAKQTRYLQNVAYIRLKNLQIGYSLPKTLVSKWYMQDLRVYLSAENLWTWSPLYKRTHDIEVTNIDGSDRDLTSGTSGDGLNYPQMRSISLGVTVTF